MLYSIKLYYILSCPLSRKKLPQMAGHLVVHGEAVYVQGSGFFMQTARACGAAGGWLIVGHVADISGAAGSFQT